MNTCQDLHKLLKDYLGSQFSVSLDEKSNKCIVRLPFRDSMGDNFVIRVAPKDSGLILDDAGLIHNTLFVMSETTGGTKSTRLVSTLVEGFGASEDEEEGVLQLTSPYGSFVPNTFQFMKLLVTLDTMLVQIAKEERQIVKAERQSLGPRASQRMQRSLRPLIQADRVHHRFTVDGLAVPDWMVDFAYKPTGHLGELPEMVILIAVDLAVADPILRAAHAFSRTVDIKGAHRNFDIRIAFDRHGQNSDSLHAADFLTQHSLERDGYRIVDLSQEREYLTLVEQVHRETGMSLAV